MPFYQNGFKTSNTAGNADMNGLYQNNGNNNHSSSAIGMINAGIGVSSTSSPFR